ncbi:hypothetical protein EHW99_1275 [Erwinia amylovora]|uniref:Uncharacterized protein n=2 Tax=Erwinia amylovora TaxID=552 RepID=A0A831EKA4_ERWAM|nr:hypothetical protein EaACW_2331 [Erwinia amylovora ACW56400]QJQ53980.1 hypothetical protein EHX00_1275 [Erwinia amylovora]CBA21486.1 hypothetical protein predicted by Glimmer/Critica [Erwinia amylovora CFBP1430]CCO79174.1 hypothetical protein BN432_2386 [Erwinia amylovora Ea356]CCO82980.1 hypothetical protein BN433_2419 [Erwinia amylovora Ea266]CCO86748.1 hypothetical protein BN434_2369 [Erwinia amylovora CFBP 2585]CCO90538.1 hypothetical protein BN435_2378 [Erwinia amylovora 01SFR-BO]CCO
MQDRINLLIIIDIFAFSFTISPGKNRIRLFF